MLRYSAVRLGLNNAMARQLLTHTGVPKNSRAVKKLPWRQAADQGGLLCPVQGGSYLWNHEIETQGDQPTRDRGPGNGHGTGEGASLLGLLESGKQ